MNVLIVEGDFPFWRGFVIEQWKRAPARMLLLSQAPSLWRREDWTELQPLPLAGGALDVPALRALVERFGGVAGAGTMFEPAVGRTLEIQRALSLPQLSSGDPRSLRNKGAMVETVQARGLAAPRTVAGTDADDVVARALAALPMPVVVKPSELAGKAGVKLVRDRADLHAAVTAALAETLPFEIDGKPTSVVEIFGCERGVLVQEYVDGPEFSIEGWASQGRPRVLAVTEKIHSGPPLFEELGHLQPARIDEGQRHELEQYACAVSEAFGLQHCAFHVEARLSSAGPVLMEINCRIAGDMIAKLMELRSSLVTGDALLGLAAGARVEPPAAWVGAAGVRMVTSSRGGTLRSLRAPVLRGDRELAAFDVAVGGPVHDPKPGGVTRLGYLIASADDPDAVVRRLDELSRETQAEVA